MTEIPLKPFPKGKISPTFGGEASSPLEVIERARIAVSPRGAWSAQGLTTTNKGGTIGRCVVQLVNDVDGKHAVAAKTVILTAIKQLHPGKYSSIESFNDSKKIHKHDVIAVLDLAAALAKQ